MECNKTINSSILVKKCRKCGMDLCESCYKKHGSVCIWCFGDAADTPLWLIRIAKILMALSPLFGFLVPAPVPIMLLLQTNTANWLWGFVYTGAFLMVFGILLGAAKAAALKSIVVKTSTPAATTPVRDVPALSQPAPTVLTTTQVSKAEQPYNAQNMNVQMSTPSQDGANAQVQDNNLVFDIAAANNNVTEPESKLAGGVASDSIDAPTAGVPEGNDAQETPSAEAQAPEIAPIEAIPQPVPSASTPQDASQEDKQSQDLSISSLDLQLLGDVSGGKPKIEELIARPDGTEANQLHPEGDAGFQPSIENARAEAILLEEQGGDACEGEKVVAEAQQIEQGLTDPKLDTVPQEIPASADARITTEQEVPTIEPVAAPGESLNENSEPAVEALSQDGSNHVVEKPTTDAIYSELTSPSESLVFTPVDEGIKGPSSLKCSYCGKDLTAEDVFCPNCGFDVKN